MVATPFFSLSDLARLLARSKRTMDTQFKKSPFASTFLPPSYAVAMPMPRSASPFTMFRPCGGSNGHSPCCMCPTSVGEYLAKKIRE